MDILPLKALPFRKKILHWFDQHGRKNLPWQENITPYRVWVSEIMLQQTQVNTVIPYYLRFMQQFPTIAHLAKAKEDAVLNYWTGLGYYARARNLHKTAKILVKEYQGHFPGAVEQLEELPGIGRSTAGAIAAIALGQSAAILDGNVKRVLARFAMIEGWYGIPDVLNTLWKISEYYTPKKQRIADYTQAMMDLGAMVCTRSKPNCTLCPLQQHCLAYKYEQTHLFPTAKPNKSLPHKYTQMLILQNAQGEILLEKRPPAGIWGGLWSFPECAIDTDIVSWCKKQFGITIKEQDTWPSFRHTFSHFHLTITPVLAQISTNKNTIMATEQRIWYNPRQISDRGFAAPIRKLIHKFRTEVSHGT